MLYIKKIHFGKNLLKELIQLAQLKRSLNDYDNEI